MLKRLPTHWLASSLFLAALLVAWPDQAQAQVSDQFSTSDQYDQFAVGGAHRWYDHHTADFRQKASHCLSMLDEAKAYQEQAFALYAQAKQPGLASAQRTALHRQGAEQIKLRGEKLRAFTDCVNQANRRPMLEGRVEQNEPPQDQPPPPHIPPPPSGLPEPVPPAPPPNGTPPPGGVSDHGPDRYKFGKPDPQFMFADGISKGMSDCFAENLPMDMATAPLAVLKRLERLKKAVEVVGKAGSVYAIYEDIKAYDPTADPYEVGKWLGKLICDGKDLRELIKQKKKLGPGQEQSGEPTPHEPSPEEPPGSSSCGPQREDCFWRTLHNATGDPSYLLRKERPTWEEVYEKLKQHFGGANAKDPLTRRPGDLQKIAEGSPVSITTDDFAKVIARMPNNSEGMVFVVRDDGSSHVFNVAKFAGQYVFWDDQVRSSNMDILFAGVKTLRWFRYK